MFSWNPFARGKKTEQNDNNVNTYTAKNNAYNVFSQLNNDIVRAVSAKSVVNQNVAEQQQQPALANPVWQAFQDDSGMIAMPVATNKAERIAQYRTMAKHTQTQWCLDEIADEFINEDEHGNIINLFLPDGDPRLNETRKAILQNEFKKYMNLFNLRDEGHNLMKRFLVEGELAWENIINKDYLQKGIIGVRFLPAEYYEPLIDLRENRPAGILFDTEKLTRDIREILSNNYLGSAQVFNAISPCTFSFSFNKDKCIPMLWPQLTYINSGNYSLDNSFISYPMVERAKQAYYQLTLLQDAAVILRVTRAPERLLFNVSTGKMTQNYADEYVRNFANSLKARKIATSNGRDIQSVYNPVSMLESYIFGKSDGNDGTTVESVTSTAQYDQIEDIKFFFKLYVKQFKVPFSRFEQPENAKPADNQIPQEEFSFLQQEVRLQRRFAAGFKRGFITHLKLRDIWDKYELNEADINVEMVRPSLYNIYNNQQILETKMAAYKAIVDNEEFSKMTAMKKILGYSDADVKENFKNLAIEKCLTEVAEFWSSKVNSEGPAGEYNKPPIPIKGISDKEDDGGTTSDSDEGEDDESGDSDDNAESEAPEAGSEAPEEPKAPEEKEAPAPTFGLG